MQPPHPWAGRYPLNVFRSFGWQTFSNVTLPMVTLTTLQQSMALCTGGLTNVTGKLVAYVFPIITTSQPALGKRFAREPLEPRWRREVFRSMLF